VVLAEVQRLRLLIPELERLRLDVARLKTELSEARKAAGDLKLAEVGTARRESPVAEKRGPRRADEARRSVVVQDTRGDKVSTRCGGRGRCGVLGCTHEWSAR